MPRLVEYRWLRGLRTASASFSTATAGDGMSGLPNARSMTSSPARRSCTFNASICGERVGRQGVDPAELHRSHGTSRSRHRWLTSSDAAGTQSGAHRRRRGVLLAQSRPHLGRVRARRIHAGRRLARPRALRRRRRVRAPRPSKGSSGRTTGTRTSTRISTACAAPDDLRAELHTHLDSEFSRRPALDSDRAGRTRRARRARRNRRAARHRVERRRHR